MKYDDNLWYILQGQTLSEGGAFVMKKSQGQKPWDWQLLHILCLQRFLMHFYTLPDFWCKRLLPEDTIFFFLWKDFVAETSQKLPKIENYHKLPTKISILEVFLYHTLKFDNK